MRNKMPAANWRFTFGEIASLSSQIFSEKIRVDQRYLRHQRSIDRSFGNMILSHWRGRWVCRAS